MFLNTILENKILELLREKDNEKFINQQIKQRQREISNLPKAIVNKRKSSMNFNFPEIPP